MAYIIDGIMLIYPQLRPSQLRLDYAFLRAYDSQVIFTFLLA